jgi:hypothetical protein
LNIEKHNLFTKGGIYISQSFANNTSSRTSVVIGFVLGVIGLGLMIINILIGFFFVIIGVILFFVIRYFANDTSVLCHDDGFSVTIISKRKGTSVHEYTWQDVTETLYYEKESSGENNTTTCYFQANTEEGVAFTLAEMKNFDELIQIFNNRASHLPYYWEKPKGILKTSYVKQNRISHK